MKSKANTIVIAFILLPLALSICGCDTVLCMPKGIRVKQTGPELDFTVPVTAKKASEPCTDGLVIDRRILPGQVPFLWRIPGDDAWTERGNNKYADKNVHEKLECKINVSALNALGAIVKGRRGEAEGPYTVEIELPEPFLKGLELGRRHRSKQLKTYRLLIALIKSYPRSSMTHEDDRDEFLRGFGHAYSGASADAGARAKRVEGLLKKSLPLEDSIYRKLLEQGGMHEKGALSNVQIANVIKGHIGSQEQELACKAGYIEGYIQAHSNPDKEGLYVDALWMYLAVRPPM